MWLRTFRFRFPHDFTALVPLQTSCSLTAINSTWWGSPLHRGSNNNQEVKIQGAPVFLDHVVASVQSLLPQCFTDFEVVPRKPNAAAEKLHRVPCTQCSKQKIYHVGQKMLCTKLYLASVLCKFMLALKRSQGDMRNHSLFLVWTLFIQAASCLSHGENHPRQQPLTPSVRSQMRTFHQWQTWDCLHAESFRIWLKSQTSGRAILAVLIGKGD